MQAYQSTVEAEQAKLDRLEKILSIGEASAFMYDLDEGRTLNKVLATLDEQGEDTLTLRHALRNTRGARGNEPIVLFQNPTAVKGIDGKTRKPNPMDRFRTNAKIANEDQLTDHRGAELPWIKRKPSADNIATVKRAAAASRANVAACRAEHNQTNLSRNPIAESILLKAVALKETAASDTIKTYKAPSTHDPRITDVAKKIGPDTQPAWQVQKNVADIYDATTHLPTNDTPALRYPSYANTQSHFPPEFAASTIKRPSNVEFKSNYLNDQGSEKYNQPSAKPPQNGNPIDGVSMGGRTYRDHPAQEPQQFPHQVRKDNIEAGPNIG
jgi:hypothetical protein